MRIPVLTPSPAGTNSVPRCGCPADRGQRRHFCQPLNCRAFLPPLCGTLVRTKAAEGQPQRSARAGPAWMWALRAGACAAGARARGQRCPRGVGVPAGLTRLSPLCRVSPDGGRPAGAQRRDDQGSAQRGSAPGFPDAGGDDGSAQGRAVPQPRGAAGEWGRPGLPLPPPAPCPSTGSSTHPVQVARTLCPSWARAPLALLSGDAARYKSVALIT